MSELIRDRVSEKLGRHPLGYRLGMTQGRDRRVKYSYVVTGCPCGEDHIAQGQERQNHARRLVKAEVRACVEQQIIEADTAKNDGLAARDVALATA